MILWYESTDRVLSGGSHMVQSTYQAQDMVEDKTGCVDGEQS